MALYAATKHAVEGYSESLDHELRTMGIRVSTVQPAYTKTGFDSNLLEPDAKLDEYSKIRLALDKRVKELVAGGDEPTLVANTVVKAVNANNPKISYTAGSLAFQLKFLRRFAPDFLLDKGLRNDLQLDV